MQRFEELLAVRGSVCARTLRHALAGLVAQLRAAQAEEQNDPGGPICRSLITELDKLLCGTSISVSNSHAPSNSSPSGSSPAEPDLSQVRQVVCSNLEMTALNTLGDWPEDDGDFWTAANLLGLRVAPTHRVAWQQMLAKAAGSVNASNVLRLPLPGDELIFPGVGKGKIQGWQADPTALLDARLGEVRPGVERTLAGVLTVCLKMLQTDHCLHHALYGLFMFGVKPLDLAERESYATELLTRWSNSQAVTEPVERLLARIALDEAIHSLIHRPTASRDSWWGKVQYLARATLDEAVEAARRAGHEVFTQALWGPYKSVRVSTERDIQADTGSVPPGEVLACLRVAATIDGRAYPGRVLYRSTGV